MIFLVCRVLLYEYQLIILLQVGLPYIRAKAQDYYEALGGGADHDVFDEDAQRRQARSLSEEVRGCKAHASILLTALLMKTVATRLRRLYKQVYPWLNTGFEVWLLICNVAYLFDKTPYYRPWLRWAGVDIRRLGMDDMVRLDERTFQFCHSPTACSWLRGKHRSEQSLPILLQLSGRGFEDCPFYHRDSCLTV